MVHWSFATYYQHTTAIGGLLALTCSVLLVSYRLATQQQITAEAQTNACEDSAHFTPVVRLYISAALPWLLTLAVTRGSELGTYTFSLTSWSASVRSQWLIIAVSSLFLAVFAASLNSALFNKRWAWETVSTVLWLQLCWVLVAGGQTLFAVLLWLEICSLNALLLLTFSSINLLSRTSLYSSWRAVHISRQLQLGFLSAILAFLWAGGFSALLLLLMFSHSVSMGADLSFAMLTVNAAQVTTGTEAATLPSVLLAAGFLTKLLLQPFQFFLLSFYKRLSFPAFSMYILFYYVFLVPVVILTFGPSLCLIVPGWFLTLFSITLFIVGLLGGSLTTSVDVRSTLAFSTIVNLSILLLTASACL